MVDRWAWLSFTTTAAYAAVSFALFGTEVIMADLKQMERERPDFIPRLCPYCETGD